MLRNIVLATSIGLAGTATAAAMPGSIPTFERVMPAGHTLKVASLSAIDQACHSLGPFTIGLIDAPHDGRVEVVQGTGFPNFFTWNTRSSCNTRKLPATIVSYTPAPGYVGEDDFAVEIVGPQGHVGRARYRITVR